jgi:hypothetical protein
MPGGDAAARRAAAWRFLRAVLRSQADGVVGAAVSGLAVLVLDGTSAVDAAA